MILAAVLFVASCSPKDPVVVFDQTAAEQFTGTWPGTWSIISSESAFGENGYLTGVDGTLSLAPLADTIAPNLVRVTIYRDTLPGDTETWERYVTANIAHAGQHGCVFNNDATTNELGSPCTGRVFEGDSCMFTFTVTEKIRVNGKRPKNVINVYTFRSTGGKQPLATKDEE